MNYPILQVDLTSGRIERIVGDFRLYAPLAERVNAPALDVVLKHTAAANVLPNGEPAQENKSLDEQPIVWYIDTEPGLVSDHDYYWLRNIGREVTIGIRLDKTADRANIQTGQVSIDAVSPGYPSLLEELLKELGAEADLAQCAVKFPRLDNGVSYLCDTIKVAEDVRSLRERKEQFIASIMSTPIAEDEE